MTKKEVATKAKSELSTDLESEFLEDAEQFEEHLDQDDMAIPFLRIIQAMSHEVTEGDAAYLDNAVKSNFFNTVSKKCYDSKDKGLIIIPVGYKRSSIEWVLNQGGFVAEYTKDDALRITTERSVDNEDIILEGSPLGTPGNQLVDTATHYVLVVDPDTGTPEPAVISMSSSQFKVSKNLNSQINMRMVQTSQGKRKAPRFWDAYRVKTAVLSNDQGTWYGWDLRVEGPTVDLENGRDLYALAKDFALAVKSNAKSVDYAKSGQDGEEEAPF